MAFAGLFVLFLGAQLVPVQRTNPPVVGIIKWDSPQTQDLFQRACMDCHSNQTAWPWYSYVAPVSWLIARDVNVGRRELNISNLSADPFRISREMQRIGRVIQSGRMPPAQYLWTHPQARLTPDEKNALIAGLQNTFSQFTANP